VQPSSATPAGPVRVLETSPRLGGAYRRAMGRWFDYLCSDFDERAHSGTIRLDLQAIDLPSDSIDVILTPHVLEHVPDTDRALAELHRILRPGGTLLLQVPLLQGHTAPPSEPEFHGDDTPVCWRFGPDLGDRLASAGFDVALLVTEALYGEVASPAEDRHRPWPQPVSPEFDAEGLLRALRGPHGRPRPELQVVADDATAARFGFEPAYMYLTWAARRR
jgi:SAM-dependent methyltransferase